jgi:hypothetical protein
LRPLASDRKLALQCQPVLKARADMFLTWKYATYVVFPLLAFFACVNVRSYFKGWKYQEQWSCLAGTAFGILGVAVTQPLGRMPLMLIFVLLTGLLTYFGLTYMKRFGK